MLTALHVAVYVVLAPLAGGLLAGLDRKISARLQGRVGPPVVQPFYDVFKLMKKETLRVNRYQNFYIFLFLVFMIFTGSLIFTGADMLLMIFALTLSGIFLVLAAFSVDSPFSHTGAEREIIQMMSCDPMLILVPVGMYLVTGSFRVSEIAMFERPLIMFLPGVFTGYVFILTMKFRKSPFDLSMAHHAAHQEIVKGLTTEFSGKALAAIEVAHWYENVLLLAIVYLFFARIPVLAAAMVLFVFLLEIFIDNINARFRWELAFSSTWIFTLVTGGANIIILYYAYSI
ncbi:MAG TPA: NADH-quinone oxidoreductase subunit H [Spirochaetota bacterium]|nr:NADH-quinone oxidoreductase subunit H [Spirochaetota bacterium]